jgi:hypothetical protein
MRDGGIFGRSVDMIHHLIIGVMTLTFGLGRKE